MKRKILLFLGTIVAAAILTMWVAACEEEANYVPLDVTFSLAEGDSKILADSSGLILQFLNTDENSLCPSDVECVRMGNFTMTILLSSEETQLSIGDLMLPQSDTISGYSVSLEQVLYPTKTTDAVDDMHPTTVELLVQKVAR